MDLWQGMLRAPVWQYFYYFTLVLLTAAFTSHYLQKMRKAIISVDIIIYAALVSMLFFIFVFATYWWSFPSAILSGVLGAFFWTNRTFD
jgi:hypothetical protein